MMLMDALIQARDAGLRRLVLMAAVGVQAVLLGCDRHTAPPPAPGRQLHNQAVLFSPDGRQVVVARGGLVGVGGGEGLGEIQFLDAKDLARKSSLRRPGEIVTQLAYSPDGKLFAFGTDAGLKGGAVVLQEVGGQRQRTLEHSDRLYSIAFTPDGRSSDRVSSIAFSPDGRYLAAGFFGGDTERGVTVWEVESGERLLVVRRRFSLQENQETVLCVCFTPDGKKLVAGGNEKLQLRECGSWREAGTVDAPTHEDMDQRIEPIPVYAVFFPTREPTLVFVCRDGTITTWDLKANREVASFSTQMRVRAAAFSPEDKVVAISDEDKTVKLWDLAKEQELLAIPAQKHVIHSLAFSPDGKRLVTAEGRGTTVRLWDTAIGKELATAP